MAPFDTTPTSWDHHFVKHRGHWYHISLTATTGTTTTVNYGLDLVHTASTHNYEICSDPLPKCETDSALQLARMAAFRHDPLRMAAASKPVRTCEARRFRHLPRGKLRYWRSLNEKRMAWGIT